MVKKGSSLILVLISLVVISIFGAAVISLTTSNFKLTKATNEDIRMKYFAESGLELVAVVMKREVSSDDIQDVVDAINDATNYDGLITTDDDKKLKLMINGSLTDDGKIIVLSNCSYEDQSKHGNKNVVVMGVYSIDSDNNVTLEGINFE